MLIEGLIMVAGLKVTPYMQTLLPPQQMGTHRPAFERPLKHVSSLEFGSFKKQTLDRKASLKPIYIDWKKIYWGDLSELIYGEEESEDLARELRRQLRGFANQYGFRIVWQKTSEDVPDGTLAFIQYWDKGLAQSPLRSWVSFNQLCALGDSEASSQSNKKGI